MNAFVMVLAPTFPALLLFPGTPVLGQAKSTPADEASAYLTLQPHPGETLYYIGFRTMVISAPDLDRSVVSPSGSEASFKIVGKHPRRPEDDDVRSDRRPVPG
jgi:hypothetical protein